MIQPWREIRHLSREESRGRPPPESLDAAAAATRVVAPAHVPVGRELHEVHLPVWIAPKDEQSDTASKQSEDRIGEDSTR